VTFEDVYAPGLLAGEEVDSLLDASLGPRGPDWLYDLAAATGVDAGSVVLDVGCRDGRQLVELHRRLGCRGIGVEPMASNLAGAVFEPAVALVRGRAEALPLADASVDLVWIRDVLVHVEALAAAFGEARRVLRPGGRCLVFQMFATSRLEAQEAARLWAPLAVVAANTDRAYFEEAIGDGGLHVERRDDLGSEWREHGEESGEGRTARQLLRAARLMRDRERFVGLLGARFYEVELADCLWGVYQMIGKLSPAVYVLR